MIPHLPTARFTLATILLCSVVLVNASPGPCQGTVDSESHGLKHRAKGDTVRHFVENCIELRVWREKGNFRYQYLTDEPFGDDLRYELGALKVRKGPDCRINVIVDESAFLSDLSIVPILADEAGFTNVHVYVRWKWTNSMAEIHLRHYGDNTDEVVFGHVQGFSRKHPPKNI